MTLKIKSTRNRILLEKEIKTVEVKRETMKRLNANVPAPSYKLLKIKAAKEGRSINDLTVQWIQQYIQE